jgi:hypothetical protein
MITAIYMENGILTRWKVTNIVRVRRKKWQLKEEVAA